MDRAESERLVLGAAAKPAETGSSTRAASKSADLLELPTKDGRRVTTRDPGDNL